MAFWEVCLCSQRREARRGGTCRGSGSGQESTLLLTANQAADGNEFLQILQAHQLVAVNTWDCATPCHTCAFLDHKSHIDFILMRRQQANPQARSAHPIAHFAVGARKNGTMHGPLTAWLRTGSPGGSESQVTLPF